MQAEIWKDIIDQPGYQVSNFGRIKSCQRMVNHYKGGLKKVSERIIKTPIDRAGYLKFSRHNKTTYYNQFVHRLVARSFIPNPYNYPVINHIDGNKLNNVAHNLEWCTLSHNSKHNYKIGLQKPTLSSLGKFGEDHNCSKTVLQFKQDGGFIAKFGSACEAQRKTGISQGQISRVCRGERAHTRGFVFRYEGIEDPSEYKELFSFQS